MRIVSWNLMHGGGVRMPHIISQLQEWQPDIAAFSEFRGTPPSRSLEVLLREAGLEHQISTVAPLTPLDNRLLLASRYPFRSKRASGLLAETGRWLCVELESPRGLTIAALHVPNRSSGIKYRFHEEVVEMLASLARDGQPALAVGDSNTGRPGIDEEAPFFNEREGARFDQLAAAGWIDIWRDRNPDARQYTWYNKGHGAGFRIDQAFGNHELCSMVRDMRYDWGRRPDGTRRGPSDHAAIILDLAWNEAAQ